MAIDNSLKAETERLLKGVKEKRNIITLLDNNRKYLVENIDAYISDSEHFLRGNDLVRAFEAVVWSWAWIEILEELRILKTKDT